MQRRITRKSVHLTSDAMVGKGLGLTHEGTVKVHPPIWSEAAVESSRERESSPVHERDIIGRDKPVRMIRTPSLSGITLGWSIIRF